MRPMLLLFLISNITLGYQKAGGVEFFECQIKNETPNDMEGFFSLKLTYWKFMDALATWMVDSSGYFWKIDYLAAAEKIAYSSFDPEKVSLISRQVDLTLEG